MSTRDALKMTHFKIENKVISMKWIQNGTWNIWNMDSMDCMDVTNYKTNFLFDY